MQGRRILGEKVQNWFCLPWTSRTALGTVGDIASWLLHSKSMYRTYEVGVTAVE